MNIQNGIRLALHVQRHMVPRKTTRKERSALEATSALVAVMVFTYFSVFIINAVKTYAERPKPTPHVARWSLPPIDKCPEHIKIWECIRHAEYANYE